MSNAIEPSIRSVDLRLAISEYYGVGFERKVRESASNSLAAIYFWREHVDVIAEDLGLDPSDYDRKIQAVNAVRRACGRDERDPDCFHWNELKAIINEVGIEIPDDLYYDIADVEEGEQLVDVDDDDEPEEPKGVWADWKGKAG